MQKTESKPTQTDSTPTPLLWKVLVGVFSIAIVGIVIFVKDWARDANDEWRVSQTTTGRSMNSIEERFDELEAKLQVLARAQELEPAVRSDAIVESRQAVVGDGSDTALAERVDELAERLGALEQLLSQRTAALQSDARALQMMNAGEAAAPTLTTGERQEAILYGGLTDKEKADHWSSLRYAGDEAWTDEVVLEMAQLALTSEDPELRAEIWRNADGDARSTLLVPSLLDSLRNDSSAEVRGEAAETLGGYLTEPGVINALRDAVANDASEKVRGDAQDALSGG